MSAQYDQIREMAVANARHEMGRRVREIGMQNRGPVVDTYLLAGGVGANTMNSRTPDAADDRMWCGYVVHYCFLLASRHYNVPLPFTGTNLSGGRNLRIWAASHPETRIRDGSVAAGDIFAIRNDHVGLAIGSAVNGVFPTIEGNQGQLGSSYNGILPSSKNIANCPVIVRI